MTAGEVKRRGNGRAGKKMVKRLKNDRKNSMRRFMLTDMALILVECLSRCKRQKIVSGISGSYCRCELKSWVGGN